MAGLIDKLQDRIEKRLDERMGVLAQEISKQLPELKKQTALLEQILHEFQSQKK